jgi:hypothetical protein
MPCRGGLTARPRQDHLQISIEKFDCEAQISGLRGDVAKLKQVRQQCVPMLGNCLQVL